MSGWQPIETAPHDEDILVYCPDARAPNIVIAALVEFHSDEGSSLDWTDVWAETDLDVEPMLWMPLPESPVVTQ